MAEATIKDLIKEIRVSNNMSTRIEEATLGATESVQRSIADLNTMLGKYFLAQNASRGDDLEAQREAKRNAKMKSGPTQAPSAATAGAGGGLSNFLQGLGGLAESLMFGAFAVGGAGAGALALRNNLKKDVRSRFLKGLTRAPFIGAVALFSEEIITSVFKGLTGKDIPTEDLDKFNDALNKTLLGSFLGPKGAFAGFMNSVITQTLEKQFPNKDDDESAWQQKTKLLGIELPFTNEDFAIWGGTIGSFFVPSLVTGAIRKSLGIGGGDAAADGAKSKNNAARKSFLKGFKPNMNIVRGGLRFTGWAGFAGLAGYSLIQAIEGVAADGTADPTDLMNLGISAASTISMLGMFGSTGLLMTGIAGLAIAGGYLIYNYLQKRQEKAEADFQKLLAAKEEELSGLSADEAQARYNEAVRVKNQKGKGKQSVSKEDRLNALATIQMLDQLFPNLDFAETREKQIANASSPMFYTDGPRDRTNLYDSTGKKIRTIQGGPPEGLMPLSAFYDMGERLTTSMFTGQTQDTGLFDGLKELTDTTGIQDTRLLANIVRNNNRKLDEFIMANDLMPPDLSGYSGGVGVLDMKDQSSNSSYTYAAGTDRIDPRDKALVD